MTPTLTYHRRRKNAAKRDLKSGRTEGSKKKKEWKDGTSTGMDRVAHGMGNRQTPKWAGRKMLPLMMTEESLSKVFCSSPCHASPSQLRSNNLEEPLLLLVLSSTNLPWPTLASRAATSGCSTQTCNLSRITKKNNISRFHERRNSFPFPRGRAVEEQTYSHHDSTAASGPTVRDTHSIRRSTRRFVLTLSPKPSHSQGCVVTRGINRGNYTPRSLIKAQI